MARSKVYSSGLTRQAYEKIIGLNFEQMFKVDVVLKYDKPKRRVLELGGQRIGVTVLEDEFEFCVDGDSLLNLYHPDKSLSKDLGYRNRGGVLCLRSAENSEYILSPFDFSQVIIKNDRMSNIEGLLKILKEERVRYSYFDNK